MPSPSLVPDNLESHRKLAVLFHQGGVAVDDEVEEAAASQAQQPGAGVGPFEHPSREVVAVGANLEGLAEPAASKPGAPE